MYAKVFASVFEGSMRGKADVLLVWFNMLAHAPFGVCDRNHQTIADETGLPLDRVKSAIDVLESKDPDSRTPDEDGKRIIRLSDHRDWGWKLVNWSFYRKLMSEQDRREKNTIRQQRHRLKNSDIPPPHPQPVDNQQNVTQRDTALPRVTPVYGYASDSGSLSGKGGVGGKGAFEKPTVEMVKLQFVKIGLPESEVERFWNYYESNGWRVGRNPMKNWQAASINWRKNWQERQYEQQQLIKPTIKPVRGSQPNNGF